MKLLAVALLLAPSLLAQYSQTNLTQKQINDIQTVINQMGIGATVTAGQGISVVGTTVTANTGLNVFNVDNPPYLADPTGASG